MIHFLHSKLSYPRPHRDKEGTSRQVNQGLTPRSRLLNNGDRVSRLATRLENMASLRRSVVIGIAMANTFEAQRMTLLLNIKEPSK